MKRFFLLLVLVGTPVCAATETPSFADVVWGTRTTYELSLPVDVSLLTLSAGVLIPTFVLEKASFDATTRSRDLSRVNGFDRWAMLPFDAGMDTAANVLQFAALLTPVVLCAAPSQDWVTIGVMYAESLALAYGFKEVAKTAVARPRPYTYFDTLPENTNADGGNSFFSGHTTLAFNGAVFASTVFAAYYPDSPWRIPVTVGSFALAAGTGVLRITGGNHFVSDVLTGAVVGSATGFLVPFLHHVNRYADRRHRAGDTGVSVGVLPMGIVVSLSF